MTELWLVGYDIRCPRRLKRVHHYLAARAWPIQKSIFLLPTSEGEQAVHEEELLDRIDSAVDDVRFYKLTEHAAAWSFGVPSMLEGLHVADPQYRELVRLLGEPAALDADETAVRRLSKGLNQRRNWP